VASGGPYPVKPQNELHLKNIGQKFCPKSVPQSIIEDIADAIRAGEASKDKPETKE
jgi:hypothetical protein